MTSETAALHEQRRDRQSVRTGIRWVAISLLGRRGIRFGTTIVLARLLAKEMFGLLFMATAVMNVLGAMREMGFGQAYIQRTSSSDEDARDAADTTFTISFLLNLVLYAIAMLASPWLASFFPSDAKELCSVLRVMFTSFLLDAFLTTPTFVLQKQLRFDRHSWSEIAAGVSHATVAISMASMGFGVWSLVCGYLGSRIVQMILLLVLSGWRPRFRIQGQIAHQLFSFGKFYWGFMAVSTVGAVVDKLLVGRYYESSALGAYGLAFALCNLPASMIAFLVNRVAFPTMSKMQGDLDAMRRAFLTAMSHLALLAIPAALGLVAVSDVFVVTVYGPKWIDMVPLVQILAFYGMLLSITSIGGPVLQAAGRPHVLFYTSLVHHAVLFAGLWGAIHHGVAWIAVSVVAPLLFSTSIYFYMIVRVLQLPARRILAPLARAGTAGGIMFLTVWGVRRMEALPTTVDLVLSVAVGFVTYVLLSLRFNSQDTRKLLRTLAEVTGRRKI